MTERVVTGQMTPEQALDAYAKAVAGIAGDANVETQQPMVAGIHRDGRRSSPGERAPDGH